MNNDLETDNIIEEIRDRLELTQQGKPANTTMNCKTIFQNDPLLKGAIRKNLLTERIQHCEHKTVGHSQKAD